MSAMANDEQRGAGTVTLRVLSPRGLLVEADVASVTLPGLDGDFTVLLDHHETVAQLRSGVAGYTANGTNRYLSIHGGVATIRDDQVEVLSPACERPEDIDEQRARDAHRRAKERVAERERETDMARAQAALNRALTRIEVLRLSRNE